MKEAIVLLEDENNKNQDKFGEGLMDELNEKERLGVMYFAGIKALKEKIEDSSNLLYKLALLKEDNVIFTTLFFMFVVLTGNDVEVKNIILKCKQEEFSEKNIADKEINEYIDTFNSRMKTLAQKYMDINASAKSDEDFQKNIIKEFSDYLLDELNIEKNTESYSELEQILLSALKIAFGFKDAEKTIADIKDNLSDNKEGNKD